MGLSCSGCALCGGGQKHLLAREQGTQLAQRAVIIHPAHTVCGFEHMAHMSRSEHGRKHRELALDLGHDLVAKLRLCECGLDQVVNAADRCRGIVLIEKVLAPNDISMGLSIVSTCLRLELRITQPLMTRRSSGFRVSFSGIVLLRSLRARCLARKPRGNRPIGRDQRRQSAFASHDFRALAFNPERQRDQRRAQVGSQLIAGLGQIELQCRPKLDVFCQGFAETARKDRDALGFSRDASNSVA
jgi:hypothetical protein